MKSRVQHILIAILAVETLGLLLTGICLIRNEAQDRARLERRFDRNEGEAILDKKNITGISGRYELPAALPRKLR